MTTLEEIISEEFWSVTGQEHPIGMSLRDHHNLALHRILEQVNKEHKDVVNLLINYLTLLNDEYLTKEERIDKVTASIKTILIG